VVRRIICALALLVTSNAIVHVQTPKPAPKPVQANEKEARTLNLTAYSELLRTDIHAQKVAIITEMMEFTEAEDKAFWPVYRECEADLSKLADERIALIADYAKNYETLTDAQADQLATKALDLEARRQAAKAKCYQRVKAVLPPKTAVRFLQVEHQLQLLIDLQVSASLPVVK
jgi:hypothetical protein